MTSTRSAWALAAFALLSACVSRPAERPAPQAPPVTPQTPPSAGLVAPPPPANALQAGVAIVAPAATLYDAWARRALGAFRSSCPVLMRRRDQSGLTQPGDWAPLCTEASTLSPDQATAFFRDRFDWVRVANGQAFATGYYEPEIAASRVRQPGYEVPIYRVPPDLIRCTLPDGQTGRGRIDETGRCVRYYTRSEIDDGALAGRGLELAWAADMVELVFLQIQGSGRLRLPDGSVMRIGYAGQNGHQWVPIGRRLRERNVLPPGGASMQGIKSWIAANPEEGRELLRSDPSYVFFRELTGPGPLGSLEVPVTPRASVAADPNFVPLGAPVYLAVDRPEAYGLWVAQDTGGAIKGANRFDTFWGAGPDAAQLAGAMTTSGVAYILLPKSAAARAVSQR